MKATSVLAQWPVAKWQRHAVSDGRGHFDALGILAIRAGVLSESMRTHLLFLNKLQEEAICKLFRLDSLDLALIRGENDVASDLPALITVLRAEGL